MPFTVTPDPQHLGESVLATTRAMRQGTKGMPTGQTVVGVIGEEGAPQPQAPPEPTLEEQVEMRVLKRLLTKWITPPQLSQNHPNPAADRSSFSRKMERQTLADLRRFFEIELSEDVCYALEKKFMDISP